MCWNAEISLNTFVFSSFMLVLIIYNNSYTQYKLPVVNHLWMYLFFVSFITMQLIEFFIWRNIQNPLYNNIFSICASLLLLIQPVVSLMTLHNNTIKNQMLIIYLFLAIPFAIYGYTTKHIYSSVTKLGHLQWHFLRNDNFVDKLIFLVWLFFLLFSFMYNKDYLGFGFGFVLLLIIVYNFRKDGSIGSMWCWILNTIFIFYAAHLLVYLPFCETGKVC